MHLQDQFDRILRSLHEAAFGDAVWPATAGLIDDACGLKGNHLVFGGGSVQWDTRIYFARFCLRGQRRRDLEQWYFREYWFRDERVPRARELADGVLVPIRDLYTEAERKTSATYNEALPAGFSQDGLQVRLAAPGGTRVVWALGDRRGHPSKGGHGAMAPEADFHQAADCPAVGPGAARAVGVAGRTVGAAFGRSTGSGTRRPDAVSDCAVGARARASRGGPAPA